MKAVLLACLIALLSFPAMAQDRYSGVKVLRGFVLSTGRVDPSEDVGTGWFIDANYSSVAVNAGIGSKRFGRSFTRANGNRNHPAFDEQVTNAYAGIGFSRIAQVQYGIGTEGSLVRFRSDFNFREVMDFLSNKRTRKERMLLADRITFTIAAEDYLDDEDEIFNNFTWGIGLLF